MTRKDIIPAGSIDIVKIIGHVLNPKEASLQRKVTHLGKKRFFVKTVKVTGVFMVDDVRVIKTVKGIFMQADKDIIRRQDKDLVD